MAKSPKRSYTPRERAQPRLGPGAGGVPSGTTPRQPGEAGYVVPAPSISPEEAEKKAIEEKLQMSFLTLEKARETLAKRQAQQVYETSKRAEEKRIFTRLTPMEQFQQDIKRGAQPQPVSETMRSVAQQKAMQEKLPSQRTAVNLSPFIPLQNVYMGSEIGYKQGRVTSRPIYEKKEAKELFAESIKAWRFPDFYPEKPKEEMFKEAPPMSYESTSIMPKVVMGGAGAVALYSIPQSYLGGYAKEFEEHPIRETALFAFPFGLGKVGQGAKWFGIATGVSKLPGVTKFVGTTAKFGGTLLGGYYGYEVTKGFTQAINKPAYLGRESAKLTALIGGTYIAPKLEGYISAFGRKTINIPVEYGYPQAPPKEHIKYFEAGRTKGLLPGEKPGELYPTYHATLSEFEKEFPVQAGKIRKWETPGLYVTPGTYISGSRFGMGRGGYDLISFDFPVLKTPRTLRLYGRGFKLGAPKEFGYAYITGEKSEIQSIYKVGTKFKGVSEKFRLKTEGVYVPIDIYSFAGGEKGGKTYPYLKEMYTSYYGYGGKQPLISPYYLLGTYGRKGVSYAEAKPSSYAKSYSKQISYALSGVSYAKKITPSYKPYYKPSKGYGYVSGISLVSQLYKQPPYQKYGYKPSKITGYSYTKERYKLPPPITIPHMAYLPKRERGLKRFFYDMQLRPSRRRYDPSYGAIVLDITGKEPRGKFSGLELRPVINKGYREHMNRINKALSF